MKLYFLLGIVLCFSINAFTQTKLIITYDTSGNQVTREYCDGCNSRTTSQAKQIDSLTVASKDPDQEIEELLDEITVLPNPTLGNVTLNWEADFAARIDQIKIVGYHTPFQKQIPYQDKQQAVSIDLSREPSSIYVVQFWMTDGTLITKKIIKK